MHRATAASGRRRTQGQVQQFSKADQDHLLDQELKRKASTRVHGRARLQDNKKPRRRMAQRVGRWPPLNDHWRAAARAPHTEFIRRLRHVPPCPPPPWPSRVALRFINYDEDTTAHVRAHTDTHTHTVNSTVRCELQSAVPDATALLQAALRQCHGSRNRLSGTA